MGVVVVATAPASRHNSPIYHVYHRHHSRTMVWLAITTYHRVTGTICGGVSDGNDDTHAHTDIIHALVTGDIGGSDD